MSNASPFATPDTPSIFPSSPSMLRRTPLYEQHIAAKARMVGFAGWEMPVQYAGVLPEVKAVRESAGLFDVSHMGRVRVAGPDALAYLQYVLVSDLSKLPDEGGVAQYSLLCLSTGGVIDDVIAYRLGPEEFVVVINAANRDKDIRHLREQAQNFAVTLVDESDQTALLAVQGPKAVALVSGLSDGNFAGIPRFGVAQGQVATIPVMVARTGYTGEDGFELFCDASHAANLWQALTEAGAIPCGLGSRDTLRVEAALPLYGHEMDENTLPFEARLAWVVKTDKPGDFIGKDALTQAKAEGKNKVLVGLEMEGRGIPRESYPVEVDGQTVGSVTSGTFSPMRQKGVALARVSAEHSKRGTLLNVVIRDTRHPARVVALPFYKNV
jgi:aminomethyltransferase